MFIVRLNMVISGIACGLLLMALGGPAARADDGVTLTINNDGVNDLLVSVYDLNSNPPAQVLSNMRVNGFTQVPVSLSFDDQGRANLSWTAVQVDPDAHRCGQAKRMGLRGGASVHVRANKRCGKP